MKGKPNMETIMSQIREHLLPTIDHGANGNIHHYNRVWEKIERWASMPPNEKFNPKQVECTCSWSNGHVVKKPSCPFHGWLQPT